MREFNDIVQKIFTNFPEEFNGPFGSDKQTYRAFYELRDWINNTICNDKPNINTHTLSHTIKKRFKHLIRYDN